MEIIKKYFVIIILMAVGFNASADVVDDASHTNSMPNNYHDNSFFLVSPLVGWNHNKLYVPARGPLPAVTLSDTKPEYGLFLLYYRPQMIINNMFFTTRASGSDVAGNVTFINFYGAPEKRLTWNAGGGYVWHKIKADHNTITISVPMIKAGLLLRIPESHLVLNPYLAYARESIDTSYSDEDIDALMYGITAFWQWRMLNTTLKYYYQDDLNSSESYNVLRLRGILFVNKSFGVTARFEYMEEPTTDNTSFLFGPIFMF